ESLNINNIDGLDKKYNVLVLNVVDDNGIISSKNHYFEPTKDLLLPEADINIDIANEDDGTYLNISSNALVRHLYLYDNDSELVLNDNYFDLLPGESKKIRVLKDSKTVSYGDVNFRYIRR
ncbi:MAG: hypothetical protein MI866_02905, partial [Bacteroidales bacterium]|nr:hypothetical protein [Bacteroidales bacterium]